MIRISTLPIYRYNRGGKYYQTNEYGAKWLRQAVKYGYEEGFRAGKADRDDRWRGGSYKDSYAYRDANYGYNGYYVNRSDYNYDSREGFRRGYEDGYNSRYQYGRNDNGKFIRSWITFCHKSSVSRIFAEDREEGVLNKPPLVYGPPSYVQPHMGWGSDLSRLFSKNPSDGWVSLRSEIIIPAAALTGS